MEIIFFFQNVWHPVCDSDWTQQDASVVCRELGYTFLGMSHWNFYWPIILSFLKFFRRYEDIHNENNLLPLQ